MRIDNTKHKFVNWSLLPLPKRHLNVPLQKDVSQIYISINKLEPKVVNRMPPRRNNLSSDCASKLIKPLMTISQCRASIERQKRRLHNSEKKSSLSQMDLRINNETSKIMKLRNLITERKEVQVKQLLPLSNIKPPKVLKTEFSTIVKQQIAFRKTKTIQSEGTNSPPKRSIDVRERIHSIRASSTKKLLKPIHTKSESKDDQCFSTKKVDFIKKPFATLQEAELPQQAISDIVLPTHNKQLNKSEQKLSPIRCDRALLNVKRLRKQLNLENDKQISLIPQIKIRVPIIFSVHSPFVRSPTIQLSD